KGESKTTDVNVGPGPFKYGAEMLRDPIGTATNILAPIFLKFTQDNAKQFYGGKDPKDARAQDEAVTRLLIMLTAGQGGVNVGNLLTQAVLPGPSARIQQEKQLTMQSKGVNESMKDLEETFTLNVAKYNASLHTLEVALGTTLLPMLTSIIDKLSQFLRYLDEIAQANPTTTQLTMIAGAFTAIALALSALQRMFGLFTALKEFAVFMGTASAGLSSGVTALGAAWAGAGSTITGVLAVIGAAIKRVVPIAAAFLIGWDVGTIISQLEVGGKSIHDWFVGWMGSLVTAAQNGWLRIKSFMGLITDAERERGIAENNARLGYVMSTTGDLNRPAKGTNVQVGGKIGGLPVAPHPPVAETPEEKIRRENEEKAGKLGPMPYKPYDKNADKIIYNPAADAAKQQARIDKAQLEIDLRDEERLYKANKVSIDDYYRFKEDALRKDTKAVLDSMEEQKQALLHPKQGKVDQAAVSRVSTDMKLLEMKRDSELAALEHQRSADNLSMKQKEIDLERELDSTSGNRAAAELQRQAKLADARREYWTINNRPDMVALVDKVQAQAEAGVKVNR
ncbi:MAG TPA: hypothetical protein VIY48_07885, partial [Candidatus Paceibacterota bacterium]